MQLQGQRLLMAVVVPRGHRLLMVPMQLLGHRLLMAVLPWSQSPRASGPPAVGSGWPAGAPGQRVHRGGSAVLSWCRLHTHGGPAGRVRTGDRSSPHAVATPASIMTRIQLRCPHLRPTPGIGTISIKVCSGISSLGILSGEMAMK